MFEQEVIDLLNNNLNVAVLDSELLGDFLYSLSVYLKHARKSDKMGGRTDDFLKEHFVELVNTLRAFEYNDNEIITIIGKIPSLINVSSDVYPKLLLLGVIENGNNEVRKEKLLSKPKDFMVGLSKVYARYKLISESGYNTYTWNSLVHATDKEFASIFVYKTDGVKQIRNRKPHQIFDSVEQVEDWLSKVDLSEFDIEQYKDMDVNKEFVARYGQKTRNY